MDKDYEIARPNAEALIQSLRAFGYDIATAIADLIDNSITAGAKYIHIIFEWNEGKPWIAIKDDGEGMTEEVLKNAMIPGSKSPLEERAENDLGRFGLGLKTASFSQCKRVTVITKSKKCQQTFVRCWDLDVVKDEQDWVLLKTFSDEAKQFVDELDDTKSGTTVLWEKIDRIIPEGSENEESYQRAFLDYAQRVKRHIAAVYSFYMQARDKVNFYLNNRRIEMWDPFMSNNPLTTLLPEESLYVGGNKVKIRSYILPHHSKLSQEEFAYGAGTRGWNEQQGFYIYRNSRLLVAGDWLIPDMQKKEQYRLGRICIDIGNIMDNEWGIDVKKSIAIPPISIQKEIKRVASIVQKRSSSVYRHRGKRISRENKNEKSFVWKQNVRQGKLGYSINREHIIIKQLLDGPQRGQISMLLEMIEETVPVPLIISDYTEKSEQMMLPYEGKGNDKIHEVIENVYESYISIGYSDVQALKTMATCEPFMYYPVEMELFSEEKGIKYE